MPPEPSEGPAWLLVLTVIGFVLLAGTTVVLLGLGIPGAFRFGGRVSMAAVLLVVLVAVGIAIRYEWKDFGRFGDIGTIEVDGLIRIAVAIVGGTVVTLAGTLELGLSPILSAGIVGILAAIIVPDYDVPVYCGAFVGMTSPELFGTYTLAVVAGLIASGVFIAAQPVFHGVGGKLGTTAFVGATITIVLTAGRFESEPIPDDITVGLITAYAVLGAIITFALHHRTGAGPVLASGVIGAFGAWWLPILHASGGELMAAAVFSASFAGMSTPIRIPNERWMALTGLLVGLAFVYTMPYLGGSGGKLGTIAFGACLAINGPLRGLHIVRLRRAFEGAPRRDST